MLIVLLHGDQEFRALRIAVRIVAPTVDVMPDYIDSSSRSVTKGLPRDEEAAIGQARHGGAISGVVNMTILARPERTRTKRRSDLESRALRGAVLIVALAVDATGVAM